MQVTVKPSGVGAPGPGSRAGHALPGSPEAGRVPSRGCGSLLCQIESRYLGWGPTRVPARSGDLHGHGARSARYHDSLPSGGDQGHGAPGPQRGAWLCPPLAVAGPPQATALAQELSAGLCPRGASTWSLPSAQSRPRTRPPGWIGSRWGSDLRLVTPAGSFRCLWSGPRRSFWQQSWCLRPAACQEPRPGPRPRVGSGANRLHRGRWAALVELPADTGQAP